MRVVVQDTLKNRQWVGYEGLAGFTVGRGDECDVRLPSRFVSRLAFSVDRGEEGWEVRVDPRASRLRVDDGNHEPGARVVLKPISQVRIAEFVLTLLQTEEAVGHDEDQAAIEDVHGLQRELHTAVLGRLDLRRAGADSIDASEESLLKINAFIDELLHAEFKERVIGSELTRNRLLTMDYESRLLKRLTRTSEEALEIERIETPGVSIALEEATDEFVRRLSRRLELEETHEAFDRDLEKINRGLKDEMPAVIHETPDNIKFYLISRFLKKVVCDLVFGLGPLQDLLDTPAITEIMVVSPEQVYIERAGLVLRSNRTFLGDDAVVSVIERIVAPLGRRIDRSQPLVDARLKDGSRVNAVIPPLALKGPCLTIRRFPSQRISAEDLVSWGSMTDAAFAILQAAVVSRRNIVVAGGTGSGKTTLLNALSSFIPDDERIVTIEDAAELRLDQDHVVSLETRPPNVEGKGAYTIRDLVKNSLRMRPDRVIVGECRGEEALDMLQAMNTGHDGSMTTVHANSSIDVVSRLENMCLMAVEIPVAAIRRQISQAVNLVVFIRRLKGGRRLLTQITEVIGIHPHTGEVEMRDIMGLTTDPNNPRLIPTGYMPSFMGELVEKDLIDLDRWFGRKESA